MLLLQLTTLPRIEPQTPIIEDYVYSASHRPARLRSRKRTQVSRLVSRVRLPHGIAHLVRRSEVAKSHD